MADQAVSLPEYATDKLRMGKLAKIWVDNPSRLLERNMGTKG